MRICDNGGWTDTWFARRGRVFNIAVTPGAEVRLEVFANDGRRDRVLIEADNFGDRYARWPEDPAWDRHPLLEAATRRVGIPEAVAVRLSVRSDAPPGASTGTSAAVSVALVGALTALWGRAVSAGDSSRLAHDVETETLGWQSGVQDQAAAAWGGINHIDVEYPRAVVHRLEVPEDAVEALGSRLALIYLGRSHRSSAVHEQVIRQLEGRGPDCAELEALRRSADAARDAVVAGDLRTLGETFVENTEAQARLHPALVSDQARALIAVAARHGAAGWKVNGAGGAGGSVAILGSPDPADREAMLAAIEHAVRGARLIPIRLSAEGLRVSEQRP